MFLLRNPHTSLLLPAAVTAAVLCIHVYYIGLFTHPPYFTGVGDDAFYYYQIGRNIASGLGSTFDGEHMTNGYHPLWMGLVIAAYHFFPANELAPILVLVTISSLAYIGTLILLWRTLRTRAAHPELAATLFLFWALNIWNIQSPYDGLETSLVVLLFTVFFLQFLKILETPDRFRNLVILGIMGGLMVLARADYGIFAGTAFLWLILSNRQFWLKKGISLALPFGLLVLPWFAYNWFSFGTLFPSSGLSFTRINHDWFFSKPRTLVDIILWSCFNFAKSLIGMLVVAGVPVPMIDRPLPTLLESVALGSVVAALLYFLLRTSSRERLKDLFLRDSLGQALSAMTASAIVFAFLHGGIRWSGTTRYYLQVPILATFFLLFLFEHLRPFDVLSRKARRLLVAVGLGFLLLNTSMYHLEWIKLFFKPPGEPSFIAASRWMNLNLPQDARIASFHSGTVGYYTKRFLMNADGKVNSAGYEALKKKDIWAFLQENKIDYIAEADKTLTDGRIIWLGIRNPLDHLQILQTFPSEARASAVYTIYKVISY